MGRPEIASCGRRFSSEYQPAGGGRPKGARNLRTILRAYIEAQEPRPVAEEVQIVLDAVFGKRKARRLRRRLNKQRVGIGRVND